ncbi:MAG: helicase-exonuclease AddAB subunit AddA, partial [Firmicutes bacterium]|nr:helicase-exonuclease AddAB subunit AddA [Bacillota bacterium]
EKLGVDVDNLLVVTFTNAAAAEMKERISAAITDNLALNPESAHLQKQLSLLNRANIMTLHAFCTKLIKNHYVKLNIDASVRIADDSECKILKAEAVDEVLEEMFEEEDREFIAFAESVKDETNFDNLKKILLQTYEVIQSLPFPYFWLKEAAESYEIGDKGIEETPLGKAFISACISELESVCRNIANAKDFVPNEYYANFEDDLEQIEDVLVHFKTGNYDYAWTLINTLEFSRLARKAKTTNDDWAKDSKNLREEVKKDIEKIKNRFFFRTFDEMSEDIRFCAPQLKGLYKCVTRFDEIYTALKKEKTIVDFNDLEHLTIKVLYDFDEEKGTYKISEEAFELQKNFYEIMTDEYQDSNAVQEMMLNALAGRGQNEANRFMVGDVKQSIYRFRQADPDIFLGKINNLEGDKNSEIIYLSKNFRSRRNVLDSINYVFKRLMTPENGGLVYNDKEALYYGAQFPENNSEEAFYDTELNIIDLSTESAYEDENEEEFTSAQKELTFVASRINELIEEGFPVLDKKTRQYRKIRYSDIVVLLRAAKAWSVAAEEVFEKFSIPVFTGSDGGYFDKKEIALVVSLLKVIDNSYQDIPVIAVLKSYIYGVTDNELAEIKISFSRDNFIENVYEYAENGENEEIKSKLNAFINDTESWKKISPFITVRELLWRIYTETGYYDYTGALPDGSIKQANLNLLLERAETVSQAGVKSLFDFINYIEKIEKNAIETGEAKILNENENVVRIMTIHKSKGLEFPFVFVSGLGRKFNLSDIQENYIIHNKTGIACDCVDSVMRTSRKTIAKTVIGQRVKQEMLEEEMRVLYVALTRAKEKLILTGGIRNMDN